MDELEVRLADEPKGWGRYAPLVKEGNTWYVYLTDAIEDPAAYNEVVHALYTAPKYVSFKFVISNGGGSAETAVLLIDAIKETRATVHFKVAGFMASAATMLSLSGDSFEIAEHTPFMIHNYSSGGGGAMKGHELKARQEFMDENLSLAFRDFYKGFLTDEELDDVIVNGIDIWLHPAEVRTRWVNRQAVLKGEVNE